MAGEKIFKFSNSIRPGGFPSALSAKDLEEQAALSPEEQLSKYLAQHWTRILDLFRKWDVNNDGLISRREFRDGMSHLSLISDPEEAARLFDKYDDDHNGSLSFAELHARLRQKADAVGAYELGKHQRTLHHRG